MSGIHFSSSLLSYELVDIMVSCEKEVHFLSVLFLFMWVDFLDEV